jgi:hypothetical protein
MPPWSFSEEAAAAKYMSQLQHNMWVVAARTAVLSVRTPKRRSATASAPSGQNRVQSASTSSGARHCQSHHRGGPCLAGVDRLGLARLRPWRDRQTASDGGGAVSCPALCPLPWSALAGRTALTHPISWRRPKRHVAKKGDRPEDANQHQLLKGMKAKTSVRNSRRATCGWTFSTAELLNAWAGTNLGCGNRLANCSRPSIGCVDNGDGEKRIPQGG